MKYCIYALNDLAEEKKVATCSLVNGVVMCEGDDALIANLQTFGVFSKENNKQLFPKDGQVFLDALSAHFTSGYMTAGPCE